MKRFVTYGFIILILALSLWKVVTGSSNPSYMTEQAVTRYLLNNLKKPESLDIKSIKTIEVSKGYTVTVVYRARNDFNSVVEKTQRYWVSLDGKTTTLIPYD